jgi:hypothetical protein
LAAGAPSARKLQAVRQPPRDQSRDALEVRPAAAQKPLRPHKRYKNSKLTTEAEADIVDWFKKRRALGPAKKKAAQWGISTSVLWNAVVKGVYGRAR